jgi:hypothetical protein
MYKPTCAFEGFLVDCNKLSLAVLYFSKGLRECCVLFTVKVEKQIVIDGLHTTLEMQQSLDEVASCVVASITISRTLAVAFMASF